MLGGLAETSLLPSLRFQGLCEGQLDRVANEPSGGYQGVRNHVGQCGGKLDSPNDDLSIWDHLGAETERPGFLRIHALVGHRQFDRLGHTHVLGKPPRGPGVRD